MWKLCKKFERFVLMKIIKFVATRCQILRPKCTKFNFGGAPPQTPLGELERSPDPLAAIGGSTSKGRGEGRERRGRGREGERKETQNPHFLLTTLTTGPSAT